MDLENKLLAIFHDDYPGIDSFIQKVIVPVFGDEIEYINRDFIDDDLYRARAERAGIKRLLYVADITEQNYNSHQIALFDVTLDDRVNIERARVNIQAVIRSIVMQHSHILILFHYENSENQPWRFSYAYKQTSIADTTSARRFTYVFGKDYSGRTAANRFAELAASARSDADFVKAFSVQALSDDFFDEYREKYADFCQYITGKRYTKESGKYVEKQVGEPHALYSTTFGEDDKLVRDYIKKMFGRIVFLYFLQRKGWLDGNRRYMQDLFANSTQKDNFLDGVLEPLFFEVLNTDKQYRTEAARALPGSDNIPYLNGGLFAQDDIDALECRFPEEYFAKLFDFLDKYNFTIDENDANDAEIGIDPEMLGRIFENLLEDNKDKGAFYTPKEIVDYMCRESIIAYLQDGKYKEEGDALIRRFVETLDAEPLDAEQKIYLRRKLQAVKICDPAIGSGAFPMGLVNLLSKLYVAMKADTDTAKMKRHIMEQNIYGVDIEKGAVDIARLRFWLAMIVDEEEPMPLPNLHFKIMQGNSLLESYNGIDLSDLTKYEQKTIKKQFTIDYGDDTERKNLVEDLHKYYNTSDHDHRDRLFTEIIKNVRRQLLAKDIVLPGTDPSANEDFFLWHTWFADVFANGGFDIVIGNPPYGADIDALVDTYRKYYPGIIDSYADIYKLFYALAINILKDKGILMYITSNTFISQPRYKDIRKFLLKYQINNIVNLGEGVFDAVVSTSICCMSKKAPSSEYIYSEASVLSQFNGLTELPTHSMSYDEIKRSKDLNLSVTTLNSSDLKILDEIFILKDAGIQYHRSNIGLKNKGGNDLYERIFSEDEYGFAHTQPTWYGKLINRYYISETTDEFFNLDYKDVLRSNETVSFGLPSFNQEEKIIWRQTASCLTATIDKQKRWFRNTIQCGYLRDEYKNSISLEFALAIFNSAYLRWFYNKLVRESGRVFPQVKLTHLKKLPFPVSTNIETQELLAEIVREIISRKKTSPNCDTSELELKIDIIVFHLYHLSYKEVKEIMPDLGVSSSEYDNFNY